MCIPVTKFPCTSFFVKKSSDRQNAGNGKCWVLSQLEDQLRTNYYLTLIGLHGVNTIPHYSSHMVRM